MQATKYEILAQRTFGAKVHKSNIRVKRWHNKYEIINQIERQNFWLNYFLIKSNRTALQTYKVEERVFGTPCILYPKREGSFTISTSFRNLQTY